MFDHKAFATDGMYPGLATPQAIANRGSFLDLITAVVKQTIKATTDAYNRVGAFLENNGLLATSVAGPAITPYTETNKIIVATDYAAGSVSVAKSPFLRATTSTPGGRVTTERRKKIKVQ
jgi:hypothetical protein